ncbi:hypothetical protein [Vibrio cholerae]|uniref:hypothetical protein n=1 Tax=Vibrio cholerae TaxID=666 RepID=UPI0012B99A60|nr:hypothetical protein [Vibrio cholerae]
MEKMIEKYKLMSAEFIQIHAGELSVSDEEYLLKIKALANVMGAMMLAKAVHELGTLER